MEAIATNRNVHRSQQEILGAVDLLENIAYRELVRCLREGGVCDQGLKAADRARGFMLPDFPGRFTSVPGPQDHGDHWS